MLRMVLWQLSPHEIVALDDDYDSDYLTLLPPHPMVQLATNDQLSVDLQREHIDELHKKANMLVKCIFLPRLYLVSVPASFAICVQNRCILILGGGCALSSMFHIWGFFLCVYVCVFLLFFLLFWYKILLFGLHSGCYSKLFLS